MILKSIHCVLGKPEAKKTKGTKKSKGGDGGKKKSKGKDKTTSENSEERSEASGNNKDQISNVEEKFNENNDKNEKRNPVPKKSMRNETLKKDNDEENAKHVKTSNERKTIGRSRSLSSRSFSVSKSPSPALRREIRSPPTNRNISRSPVRQSPVGYRDYRRSDDGYQDFRRKSIDRHSFPERRHQPYDRSVPRFPSNNRGSYGRDRNYDRQGPLRIQPERGPLPHRRTPPDYFRGHARMRRSDEGRHMKSDDYQSNRRQSPYRREKKSRSPIHARELTRSRSNSPTLKGIAKQQKYTAEEHSSKPDNSGFRTLHRSRKSDSIQSRNKIRGRSNSFSPSPKQGRTLSSSIGAVISHESDGEYNPERLLKKSIVASKVKKHKRK